MIVERVIGNVSIEINIAEANEVFLDEPHLPHIHEPGISGILNAIYDINGIDHLPLSVFIELTGNCNFSCPFCYIHENNHPSNHLPRFEELRGTLDYLIDAGMLYCILSGGECLLHPDFPVIYRYLKERGVLVTVFTNGYLINEKLFALFNEYKPFKVEISVYGVDDETYQVTTNNDSVMAKQVFDNILKLKSSGINVVCKTPITCFSENFYIAVQQWCDNNSIQYYSGDDLMDTYSGKSRSAYLASSATREKLKKENDKAFFEDPEMLKIAYTEKKQKINFDCSAGKTDVFIDYQYNLLPCMKAVSIPEWKFDIRQMGIHSAYVSLVDKIMTAKGIPLKHCTGCNHSEVCQECFMTQYEHTNLSKHRNDYCRALSAFLKKR